jgi:predicted outer membrane repeat protein
MSEFTGNINLYNGTLKLTENGTFFNADTLNLASGTLNIFNNKIDDITVSNFISTNNTNLILDVNLNNNTSDNFTVTDSATGTLEISKINVIDDSLSNTGSITLFNNMKSPTLSSSAAVFTSKGYYSFSSSSTLGLLNYMFTACITDLNLAVSTTTAAVKNYSLNKDENVTPALGQLEGTELTIFGNNYSIQGNNIEGIMITGEQTLNIYSVKSFEGFTSTSTLPGGAIRNYSGMVNIKDDIVFSSNTANFGGAVFNSVGEINIVNEALFTNNLSVSSGGSIYNFYGMLNIGYNAVFSSNTAGTYGGAIYNEGSINVNIGNNAVFSSNTAGTYGGAIYNYNGIINIGDNVVFSSNTAGTYGGAVFNYSARINIGDNAIFTANSASEGGAIRNYREKITIEDNAYFNSNSATYGGAICNTMSANLIILDSATFVNNTATGNGGAIYNEATLTVENNVCFNSNTANSGGAVFNRTGQMNIGADAVFSSNTVGTYGGAIYNYDGTVNIGDNAYFNSNSADSGGAICNTMSANLIILDSTTFTNNTATSNGGAIYNTDTANLIISDISTFTNNTATSNGGAIFNDATLTVENNACFNSNTADSGGAVYNDIEGVSIFGDNSIFNFNHAKYGGAVYNTDTANLIILDSATFTNNTAMSNGGAVYNDATIFMGNNIEFSSNTANSGGAIYNDGTINIGDNAFFNSNTGGAISNNSGEINIGNNAVFSSNTGRAIANGIDGKFTIGDNAFFNSNTDGAIINNMTEFDIGNNSVFSANTAESGAAIYNLSGNINIGSGAIFTQNSVSYIGVIANYSGEINIADNSVFSFNTGTAIYNNSGEINIGSNAVFRSNIDGAINNSGKMVIGNYIVFDSNLSFRGGAVYNADELNIGNNVIFSSNCAEWEGGAIYSAYNGPVVIGNNVIFTSNSATYGGAIHNSVNVTISNGAEFTDNSADSKGGAIYNSGTLNLTADTINVEFTGNTATGISNAIHDNGGTINLTAVAADIIFNDRITSENNSSVININTSSDTLTQKGLLILNADMSGYLGTVNFESGIIQLGDNGTLFTNFTVLNGATFDFADSAIKNYSFKNLTVSSGSANITVDADLENESMDTVSAESYDGTGTILVNKFNILADSKINNLDITFTTSTVLKDKITNVTKASSALYDYTVLYSTNTGSFNFTKGSVNPILLEGAVSAMAGGYVTQVNVLGQAFNSIDGFISSSKLAKNKNRNLYVSAANQIFENNKIERGLWIRPYAVQETIKLENTNVDNTSYGTLAGLDLAVTENKMVSFYLGYTGSKQEYEQVKATQTGYIIGASGMLAKDNYYIALTANAGFNDVNADNDYGTDKFKILMYSIAAKAGYDMQAGKNWIIQPNLLLMYGTIKTDEYITSQGAKVDSNSTNNLYIKPQVKAKLELKNGWTPYGLTGIIFNTGSQAKTITEGIDLGTMDFDSYIEYGAGVDKKFIKTNWSIYGQIAGRSGSRNGYEGNLGVKYSF